MAARRVLWIPDFPVEALPGAPAAARALPRGHPLSWMRVLAASPAFRAGVDLHVAVLRKTIAAPSTFTDGGVTYHLFPTTGGMRLPSLFWSDTLALRGLVRRLAPDVLHAWGNERGAGLTASRLGPPWVLTAQGVFEWYRQHARPSWYDRALVPVERLSFGRARVVTTECRFMVDWLAARHPRARIHQVEHAPDPLFHAVPRAPAAGVRRILFVGIGAQRKGLDLAARAVDRLAAREPVELVLAGPSAADLDWLRRAEPGLSPALHAAIRLLPPQDPAGIARELSAASLLLLPTRADTSPNCVKEAVVAGVPVVASAVGGIPEYVEDGRNGVLCRVSDAEDTARALLEAAAHPVLGRGAVDADCLARQRDYLSVGRMAAGFLAAYEDAARERR